MSNEKDNSFRKAFYHLKLSLEYFLDFQRENPGSIGSKACKVYSDRLGWIFRDFKSNPNFPADTLEDFLGEMESDPLSLNEIARQAALLPTHQKEALETVLGLLLKGEEVTVVLNKAENAMRTTETAV